MRAFSNKKAFVQREIPRVCLPDSVPLRHSLCGDGYIYRDTSLIKTPPPENPTVALCLGTCGDPKGGGVLMSQGPL